MGLWKVEVRDMYTDKSKSTCLAFIDIPNYDEAMQIRDNVDIEWTYNGKIDAKRYESCIYPSTPGAPEMWFYFKPKLGEKTPIISRSDYTLDECLQYRNPMTRGMSMASKPNHGYYTIKPRLMKGASPRQSHKGQDGLDRPFGSVHTNDYNIHGRNTSGVIKDHNFNDNAHKVEGSNLTETVLSPKEYHGRTGDHRGYMDREFASKDLIRKPETKEYTKIRHDLRKSRRVENRNTPRGKYQQIENKMQPQPE